MTAFETIRMACYVVSSIALFYKALAMMREHRYGGAGLRWFLVALFTWYIIEITLISQGINTRDYRIIGTPMIVGITAVAVAQAIGVWKEQHGKNSNSEHENGFK